MWVGAVSGEDSYGDMAGDHFARVRALWWRRPDLRCVLIHVGAVAQATRGAALGGVAWTAEFGALGLSSLLAQRTGDATARVGGDCPTAPIHQSILIVMEYFVIMNYNNRHKNTVIEHPTSYPI